VETEMKNLVSYGWCRWKFWPALYF